jgi:pilus assembly protein Flp/PilA
MKRFVEKFLKDESGASLIEYVLIGAVISIGSIALMRTLNTTVQGVWTSITTELGG